MIYKLIARLLILFVVGSLAACKQPIDFLPPATQTGQNTVGCLINGQPYIPDGAPGSFSGPHPVFGGLSSNYSGLGLGIRIQAFSKNYRYLDLYTSDHILGLHLLNTGDYKNNTVIGRRHYGEYISDEGGYQITSSKYTGWINLTKVDTVSGIVSGTFEFTGADSSGRTVSITNGRFDVNPRTQ